MGEEVLVKGIPSRICLLDGGIGLLFSNRCEFRLSDLHQQLQLRSDSLLRGERAEVLLFQSCPLTTFHPINPNHDSIASVVRLAKINT
jgi:hypothetical protein